MSVLDLPRSTQDFLKAVWSAKEWHNKPVTPTAVARRLGLSVSTVSSTYTRLTEEGYVRRCPQGSILLTPKGEKVALQMVRRHRLLETFLVKMLGYNIDQVHQEAESLEHSVSDFFISRIDTLMKSPKIDPHGDPIPGPRGGILSTAAIPVAKFGTGQARVVRINDQCEEVMNFCVRYGLEVGTAVEILPEDNGYYLRISSEPELRQLPVRAAEHLYVSA